MLKSAPLVAVPPVTLTCTTAVPAVFARFRVMALLVPMFSASANVAAENSTTGNTSSKAPISRVPEAAVPRWSLVVAPAPEALMAGDPEMRAWVWVGPPLLARVVLMTAVAATPVISPPRPVLPPMFSIIFAPLLVNAPTTSPVPLPTMILLLSVAEETMPLPPGTPIEVLPKIVELLIVTIAPDSTRIVPPVAMAVLPESVEFVMVTVPPNV